MSEEAEPLPILSRRKALLNLVGFAVGLALFAWIVVRAAGQGDWDRLRETSPVLIAALTGCTLLSMAANGAIFWVTGIHLRPVGFWNMQLLQLVSGVLNYAPFRLGAFARVAYHMRVDRLRFLEIGAWFTMVFYTLALGVAACVVATLVAGRIDWRWAALVAGQLLLAGVLTRALVSHPLVARYGQGVDRMLGDHVPLWSAIALRMVDIAAFAGRMAAALAILDIHVPGTDVVILALVALLSSLVPFGRLGFREFCVYIAASRLSHAGAADVPWEQLALIESAGEALVLIPLGGVCLLWFRRKWRGGSESEEVRSSSP